MRYNNEPIHTIKLYGKLRQKFGKELRLSGHSAAATIRGFALQNKEFGDALVHGFFRVLRGEKLKSAIPYAENEIGAEIGSQSQTFHLIPVPAGSKSGIFSAIAGVVIMAAAIICAPWTGGASLAANAAISSALAEGATVAAAASAGAAAANSAVAITSAVLAQSAFMGISYGAIAMFGLGLTLMGVAQMTAKAPETGDSAETNESAVISGPQNTTQQGAVVPLVYGHTITGSVVIASNLTSVDYSHKTEVSDSGTATTPAFKNALDVIISQLKPNVVFSKKFAQIDSLILRPLTTDDVTVKYEYVPKNENKNPTGLRVWATKKVKKVDPDTNKETMVDEYVSVRVQWKAVGTAPE